MEATEAGDHSNTVEEDGVSTQTTIRLEDMRAQREGTDSLTEVFWASGFR